VLLLYATLPPHSPALDWAHFRFQRDEGTLIIWDEELDNIIELCKDFEEKMMKYIWRSKSKPASLAPGTPTASRPSSLQTSSVGFLVGGKEEYSASVTSQFDSDAGGDPEKSQPKLPMSRPMMMYAPFYIGLGAGVGACE
jgi:hypothetical protein